MKIQGGPKRMAWFLTVGAAVLGLALLVGQPVLTAPGLPLLEKDFAQVNEQGFGDRNNSWAWSMQWWRGKLYVGTSRAEECTTMAALALQLDIPGLYPPTDPDVECTASPQDLPLQAEIWRYTPETATWERVFQSPNDVEIPDHPGKFVARDMGFRGMTVFTEADGTEALYVSGVTSNPFNPGVPPPRILRSTDGVNFQPVPQDPGTFLGDLGDRQASFRDLVVYKGRLYVVNGPIQGSGALLEAENPAGGNDNFRPVTPEGMRIMGYAPFNGYLYLGVVDVSQGFSVVKTDAAGTPPYDLVPVITNGGFLRPLPSTQVLNMREFQGRLYMGTDKPAEVYRINPDDTWDLIVGTPRETPEGMKYPLSGMDRGFDYFLNQHVWRMQDHEGWLYIGTMDASTAWRTVPFVGDLVKPHMGFDLFATRDGWHYTMITRTGFGSMFDYGVRTFASTPFGLFLGTANEYYGTGIYQGVPGEVYEFYLPIVQASGNSTGETMRLSTFPSRVNSRRLSSRVLAPPQRLMAESHNGVVLSWDSPYRATRFRIFRSTFTSAHELRIANVEPGASFAEPFSEVGVTNQSFFVDTTVQAGKYYHYYVQAEDIDGAVSQPSNLVRAPSLFPEVTFDSLEDVLADWARQSNVKNRNALGGISLALANAHDNVKKGNLNSAVRQLAQLHSMVMRNGPVILDPWRQGDLEVLLVKLARRVRLVQCGAISRQDVY